MIQIWKCRRSSIAVICIIVLGVLGYTKGIDVASALAAVAIGVAGSNAYEKRGK